MNRKLGDQSLSHRTAQAIQTLIIEGQLQPLERLNESALSEKFSVSRNTLREGFRLLTQRGLLVYQTNKGVCVACPQVDDIIDIYRIRRLIETDAIYHASPFHPALKVMKQTLQDAKQASQDDNWQQVGTANMDFHEALVSLSDSPRMQQLYWDIAAELRLAFNYLGRPKQLHTPYIERNQQLLDLILTGQINGAVQLMSEYLTLSERLILTAYSRHQQEI